MTRSTRGRLWVCLVAGSLGAAGLGLLVGGCGKKTEAAPPAPASVTVSQPIRRTVVQWDEYAGNLTSPEVANVSARVSGLIEQAPFKEGAIVRRGDVLFEIDPRPFQADYDSKQAAVAQAQAQADQAEVHFRRYAEVRGTKAISADDYDQARASNEVAQASLTAAKAALETSALNLKWTHVTAPIGGRVGRMNVTVGNLVSGGGGSAGGGQPTLLTTIVSIDPMYCYVQVPEEAAVRYDKLAIAQGAADLAHAHIACYLQLTGESSFTHAGVIDFVDNQVDTGTGTVTIRGVFPNPNGLMTSGMFARLRVAGSAPYEALLIPDAAINADQNERYVLTVDASDVVHRQSVELGPLFGNLRQIDKGVEPGQWVIVSGVQKAQGGAKVKPHQAPVSTATLDALEATGQGVSPSTRPITQPATRPETSFTPSSGTPGEGRGGGSSNGARSSQPPPYPPPEYRGRGIGPSATQPTHEAPATSPAGEAP